MTAQHNTIDAITADINRLDFSSGSKLHVGAGTVGGEWWRVGGILAVPACEQGAVVVPAGSSLYGHLEASLAVQAALHEGAHHLPTKGP